MISFNHKALLGFLSVCLGLLDNRCVAAAKSSLRSSSFGWLSPVGTAKTGASAARPPLHHQSPTPPPSLRLSTDSTGSTISILDLNASQPGAWPTVANSVASACARASGGMTLDNKQIQKQQCN